MGKPGRPKKPVLPPAEAVKARLRDKVLATLSPAQKSTWSLLEETDLDLGMLAKLLAVDLLQMGEDFKKAGRAADPGKYYGSRRDHIELLRKLTQTMHDTSQGGPSEMIVHVEGMLTPQGPFDESGNPVAKKEGNP